MRIPGAAARLKSVVDNEGIPGTTSATARPGDPGSLRFFFGGSTAYLPTAPGFARARNGLNETPSQVGLMQA